MTNEQEPLVSGNERSYDAVETQHEPEFTADEIARESQIEASTFFSPPHFPIDQRY